jgi:hypothetical protein
MTADRIAQLTRERDEARAEARAAENEEARWRANLVEALTALAAERAARAEEVAKLKSIIGRLLDADVYLTDELHDEANAALAPRAENPT